MPKVEKKKKQSIVWSAITIVWDDFRKVVRSKLRSGQNTNVWWELWTQLPNPLMSYVDKNLHALNPNTIVNYFVTTGGVWDIAKWQDFLHE